MTNLGGGARRRAPAADGDGEARRAAHRHPLPRRAAADVTLLVHRGKRRVAGVRVRNVPGERSRTRRFSVPRRKGKLTIRIKARSRTQSEAVTKRLR